jgi:peptidoglycan/xylan/chitin deacetylase (PgdA/CDA1 family)
MEPRLALKVDVDTWRGTRQGVPRLVELLASHGANATFLFSLGPDHTGRAITRLLRPGFLRKVSRTSVARHYGIRTLLYGTLLPAPDIGRREAALMRQVQHSGFEVGIHAWDHVKWQDHVTRKDSDWTRREMARAVARFREIFGVMPRTCGAAGWQMNESAYAMEREFGFDYASDGRGTHPFQPVDAHGRDLGVPQLPSTLPTLDELIGANALTASNVHDYLLALTAVPPSQGHVYTLHAELEGLGLLETFDRLLTGWQAQGYRLVSLGDMFQSLCPATLARHAVSVGAAAGRSGTLALQGEAVARLGGSCP